MIAKLKLSSFLAIIALVSGFPQPKVGDGPIVTIPQGQLQGVVQSTNNGKLYNAFLGIPYGSAPIRFGAPEPADGWTGIRDATAFAPHCIQIRTSVGIPPTNGIEDCLTLNVYSANLTSAPLPVLIFLHGGGFFEGSSDNYQAQRFFDYKEIVVVYVNYRLSAMGFLSTGDSIVPGNVGLLDQNLALKWVQNNIAAFNGDPSAVTLSGESAGSDSVIGHLVSPMSAGLFHQMIAQSGTLLNGWGMEEDPLYYAQRLGEKMDCPTTDNAEMIDCLRQQNASDLVVKAFDIVLENVTLCWVPVLEPVDGGQFITENPLTVLQEGRFNRVPIIMGFNRDEGSLVYQYVVPLMSTIDDNFFNEVMPFAIHVLTDYRTNVINISYAIKDEYYSNIDVNDPSQVTRAGLDVLGDMIIISGVVQTVEIISSYVPTWMYEFNYVGNWSWTYLTGAADCIHGIELVYLYNQSGAQPLDEKDSEFSATLVPLWADFVTEGNPTPTGLPVLWSPTPSGQSNYLSLDAPYQMNNEFQPSRINFWLNTVPAIAAA